MRRFFSYLDTARKSSPPPFFGRKNLRAFASAAILSALVVGTAGCGSVGSPSPLPNPALSSKCVRKIPSQAGECIAEHFGGKLKQTFGLPLSAFGNGGIDISVYQGVPNFLQARAAGLKFVIIQTNDGNHVNPLFQAQRRAIEAVGLPWGFYTFTEAYSGAQQAAIALSVAGTKAPLGGWTDVEVPGSYAHACEYVDYLHSHGVQIVGRYSSPGLNEGPACIGYDWPAEWGSEKAYPLRGYSYAQTVVRQFSGTGHFPGVSGEVDRDESLGLLVPAESSSAREQRELSSAQSLLKAAVRHRNNLRALLLSRDCRGQKARRHKPTRNCSRKFHEGNVANARIKRVEATVARLKRELG